MGLSVCHQSNHLSFEKEPNMGGGVKGSPEASNHTGKQHNISAGCIEAKANASLALLGSLMGWSSQESQTFRPRLHPPPRHSDKYVVDRVTLLLSLTQVFAAVAQRLTAPGAISILNESFRLPSRPHAGREDRLQPDRSTTEDLERVATPPSKCDGSKPFLVLKIVFSLQWSFRLRPKPQADSSKRYSLSFSLRGGTWFRGCRVTGCCSAQQTCCWRSVCLVNTLVNGCNYNVFMCQQDWCLKN